MSSLVQLYQVIHLDQPAAAVVPENVLPVIASVNGKQTPPGAQIQQAAVPQTPSIVELPSDEVSDKNQYCLCIVKSVFHFSCFGICRFF